MQFLIGDEVDKGLAKAMTHEMILCKHAFEEHWNVSFPVK